MLRKWQMQQRTRSSFSSCEAPTNNPLLWNLNRISKYANPSPTDSRRFLHQIILPALTTCTCADLLSADSNEFMFSAEKHRNSNFTVIPPKRGRLGNTKRMFPPRLATHFINRKTEIDTNESLKVAASWFMTWIHSMLFAFAEKQLFRSKQTCQQFFKKIHGWVQLGTCSKLFLFFVFLYFCP